MVAIKRVETLQAKVAVPGDPAWVKALFLGPAVVGSFCTLVLLGQSKSFRQGLRQWLGRRPPADRHAALAALRARVVGQDRRRVTALFGPPPAATSAPAVTWYYPVARTPKTAMAISFDGDRAVRVEFFQSPD